MGVWSVVFLVAISGFAVNADYSAIFPEEARGGARIVSGWEADEGQFPFQLSIRMVNPTGTVSSCGGTVIHPEWGLTAAHCTATRITFVVRAGTVNLTRPDLLFETTEYYNHPRYNDALPGVVQPDDISLLKFSRVLTFSANIQPIRLQASVDKNKNYDGIRLTASGWGRTWTGGDAPENLNWVFLQGVSNQDCRDEFGGSTIVQDSTICASGYNVSSQSTCQGDSGGPLFTIDVDGGITEVGISSFVSSQGCHVDIPAGFIRPGHYHDWYRDVTGIDFDWEPEAPSSEESSSEESSSEESSSEESSSEESSSSESSSLESSSSESSSSESSSSESSSSESSSSESSSSESSSSESSSSESSSSESSSSESSSSESSSSESSSSESSSSESSSSEEKSEGAESIALKPTETKKKMEANESK